MNQVEYRYPYSEEPSRRELLGYVQAIAFLWLALAFAIILIQVSVPQPKWIDLGAVEELASKTPTPRVVTLRDKSELLVWVVYIADDFLVFDSRTPFRGHCRYQWQFVTQRFEDPCSGIKFSRAGEFLDPYNQFAGKAVQNLDRYVVNVQDGHVFINANQIIHGETFIAPTRTLEFECC